MQFYIALLLLISAGAASAQLQKLDRRQAVRYALQNSPSFNSARNEREVADLTVRNSFWALFPSLDFTASYGLQDDDPSTYETPYTSQLALSLTETLYDNGVLLTQNKIANLARRRAELIFRKEKNRLVREVLEAYMKFSLQSRNLEVKETQLDLIRRQYNLVSSAYKQGLKTRKDFLRFKTQLNRTQLDMVNARNSVEKTRLDLLKAIGVQPPQYTAFSFITEPVPTTIAVPTAPLSWKNNYIYQATELQSGINRLQADITARKYFPEIYLTAGATYGSSDYWNTSEHFEDNDRLEAVALLTVKYNLWDWGIRRRDRRAAVLNRQTQENTLDIERRTLAGDLDKLMLDLRQLQQNFDLSRELLSLEENNYKALERDYREGRAQYLDLITSLTDLSDSRIRYYSSAIDLQLSVYEYRYYEGTLYDEFEKN